eukprot:NODE_95_length_21511_cov_0.501168.p19 type:complete len:137 gc:universal NODE_95_length_21511_cov_0.501168:20192-19782(-)
MENQLPNGRNLEYLTILLNKARSIKNDLKALSPKYFEIVLLQLWHTKVVASNDLGFFKPAQKKWQVFPHSLHLVLLNKNYHITRIGFAWLSTNAIEFGLTVNSNNILRIRSEYTAAVSCRVRTICSALRILVFLPN